MVVWSLVIFSLRVFTFFFSFFSRTQQVQFTFHGLWKEISFRNSATKRDESKTREEKNNCY